MQWGDFKDNAFRASPDQRNKHYSQCNSLISKVVLKMWRWDIAAISRVPMPHFDISKNIFEIRLLHRP